MEKTETILKKVLRKIKPSAAKEKIVEGLKQKLLQVSKSIGANGIICGSAAKGTWLADKNELDLFLLFPETLPRDEFEKRGLEAAKKIASSLKAKWEIEYAEHPYICAFVKHKGEVFDVDIVPAYDAQPEKIKSAVDRTPHHVKYILKSMPAEMKDEVRLLKKFLAAAGCYGADLRTSGFSGYLSELLILKYGGFLKLLKEAQNWTAGFGFDFHGKGNAELGKRFHAPLIIIDPVDQNRNVAAAVSAESFYKLIFASRAFLKNPSEKFFFPPAAKPLSTAETKKQMKNRCSFFCTVKFSRPKIHGDIIWSQLRKAMKILEHILQENGFKILKADSYFDEKFCVLIFEFESWQVSKTTKHAGPSIFAHKPSAGFLERYKGYRVFVDRQNSKNSASQRKSERFSMHENSLEFSQSQKPSIFVENENWFVETEREYTTVESFLKNFFHKNEKELLLAGIPSKLANPIRKAKLGFGDKSLETLKTADFKIFLKKYFEKKF